MLPVQSSNLPRFSKIIKILTDNVAVLTNKTKSDCTKYVKMNRANMLQEAILSIIHLQLSKFMLFSGNKKREEGCSPHLWNDMFCPHLIVKAANVFEYKYTLNYELLIDYMPNLTFVSLPFWGYLISKLRRLMEPIVLPL